MVLYICLMCCCYCLLLSALLLFVVVGCWLLLSVCLSCDSFHDVVGCCSPLLLYWIGDSCWLLNWIELKLNWNWIVVHRCQSKLCLLGLGSGGFCTAVHCVVVGVVATVVICCVDCWMIVDCRLLQSCSMMLLVVDLSCTLFYVDVLDWRLLLYWSEDCCSLLDWNWTGWIEIELVGLKLSWLNWNWMDLKLVGWIVVDRRHKQAMPVGLG